MKRQYSGYVYSKNQPIVKGSCVSWASKPKLQVQEDIVDTIIGIMEEKPRPMKGRQPTSRVLNGAEQFDDYHQKPFDRYDRSRTDWAKIADGHNRAYPVMYDELKKRRSATKPIPKNNFTSAKGPSDKTKNPRSSSEDTTEPRRPIHRRRKCRPKQRRTRKQRDISRNRYRNAKITKRRYECRKRIFSDKTCQYVPDDINLEERNSGACKINPVDEQPQPTSINEMDYEPHRKVNGSEENCAPKNNDPKNLQDAYTARTEVADNAHRQHDYLFNRGSNNNKKRTSHEEKSSDVDDENPDSNKTSVSAYESYTSLDHEPMVEN